MVTDRYLDIHHHPDADHLGSWARAAGLPIIAVDVVPRSIPIEGYAMPPACVLLFGQEGPGLSDAALALAEVVLSITQAGSTRSINVAAAAAIAMHVWQSQHAGFPGPPSG
jgi:tRNA G18 (ribose-2'-O)-methylase SpoU